MASARDRAVPALHLAYFATLAALAVGGMLSGIGRTWGVDGWGYVPRGLLVVLLGVGVLGPLAVAGAGRLRERGVVGDGAVRALSVAALVALPVAYFLLRTQGHFLGDGYQNLANLARDDPWVKGSARGTIRLLILLRDVWGGGEAGALAAYRTLAIASGVAYLALVVWAARRLVDSAARTGFVAILATCGVTVLFFGYVEHYAPLIVVVLAHALHGVHVARTGRTRWAAPGIVGAAMYLHVLGFALLPSLAWVLATRTPLASWAGRMRAPFRWGAVIGLIVVAAVALVQLRAHRLPLRFALLGPREDGFTLEGYTLFSAPHLLDLLNLAFLLLPGLAVLAIAAGFAAASRRRTEPSRRDPALSFLTVLIASTGGAVFVLDPRLGMARDWDAFAFAGVPGAVAAALAWAAAATARSAVRPAAALAALLGALVLVPRVVVLADEERATAPFRAYLDLDYLKGRNGRIHLVHHHRRLGRKDRADAEVERWNLDYPERTWLVEGRAARNRGDVPMAEQWYLRALEKNPQYFDAYNNLGDIYLMAKHPAEAREALLIADAINPWEYAVLTNLGNAELMLGHEAAAEQLWHRAQAVDPTGFHANRNLARLAQRRGDRETYEKLLGRAAASPDAAGDVLAEWAEVLGRYGRHEEAREILAEARRRGLPAGVDEAMGQEHPEWWQEPPGEP